MRKSGSRSTNTRFGITPGFINNATISRNYRWGRPVCGGQVRVIVTRRTSPTGFYGRNRHRERALHVNGRTANSRHCLSTEQSRPSLDRFPRWQCHCREEGGDRIHEESIDVRRSSFPRPIGISCCGGSRVFSYERRNVNTERGREREREKERERERGGKGGRGGEIGEWKVKEGRTRANVRLHLHGGGT